MPDFTPEPPTHWYIDYPGVSEVDGRAIPDRLCDTIEDAVAAAVGIYRDSDLPKVIVCEYPSLLRVASVWGDRSNPEVVYQT